MRNKQLPYHLCAQPDHILEIRLPIELWRRIKGAAKLHGVSYSWVVRFCLFRLIMRPSPLTYLGQDMAWRRLKGIDSKFYFRNLRAVAQKSAGAFHRHRLCLYGEDELYIRMVSAMLGVSMTHLTRLALECNLERLERASYRRPTRFFQASLYWLGIKRRKDVDFHTRPMQKAAIALSRYPKSSYW